MNRILRITTLAAGFAIALVSVRATGGDTSLDGYTAGGGQKERQWEAKFRSLPSPEKQKEYMRRLTARPHHVGSPYDKDNAEWILANFKEWGLDAHIETFDALFPTPKDVKLEMVEPRRFVAKLSEPPIAVDPTSSQTNEQLPAYNAYSADGELTAPLVYVNYGMPDDYDELDRYGVSVKGAVVITRYGHGWRGVKPKVAAEHGAVGCIIYSDPLDDGYTDGDVFPQGAWRPPAGIQRGSVMDTQYPGDPLTPGVGATHEAKRLTLKEAVTITKIPVVPISYADAQPLLAELRGRVAPRDWRGSLPITYHLGPGPAKVHLKMLSNWDQKTLYDVIARIPGSQFADEWVLRGNHHDAWVNGAEDPVSGLIALLEEARSFGELVKQGWKPKRTIVYCAWDGEEPGLLGSTEWVEEHSEELLHHAVAYFNSDTNARGYFRAEGSHVLEKFINGVARDIIDPEKDISAWERRKLYDIAHAQTPEQREEIRKRPDLRIGALGDGSDYTAFIHHLGIASADIRFSGESNGGVYHSIYDDFYWYTHFDDTNFVYGRALAQTVGTAVLRLADADVAPFEFNGMADTYSRYVDELEKLAKKKRDDALERNRELDENVYEATADPTKKSVPPPRLTVPPYLNFAPLQNGLDALKNSARKYQAEFARAQGNGGAALAKASAVNLKLMATERGLTDSRGLPDRPWFEHQIYAPGFYTGYGVKTMPAVREAIEQDKWPLAEQSIAEVGKVLINEAAAIDAATAELEKAAGQ
jgi:N-acetylated-alpha-linked acidic dipeptidase